MKKHIHWELHQVSWIKRKQNGPTDRLRDLARPPKQALACCTVRIVTMVACLLIAVPTRGQDTDQLQRDVAFILEGHPEGSTMGESSYRRIQTDLNSFMRTQISENLDHVIEAADKLTSNAGLTLETSVKYTTPSGINIKVDGKDLPELLKWNGKGIPPVPITVGYSPYKTSTGAAETTQTIEAVFDPNAEDNYGLKSVKVQKEVMKKGVKQSVSAEFGGTISDPEVKVDYGLGVTTGNKFKEITGTSATAEQTIGLDSSRSADDFYTEDMKRSDWAIIRVAEDLIIMTTWKAGAKVEKEVSAADGGKYTVETGVSIGTDQIRDGYTDRIQRGILQPAWEREQHMSDALEKRRRDILTRHADRLGIDAEGMNNQALITAIREADPELREGGSLVDYDWAAANLEPSDNLINEWAAAAADLIIGELFDTLADVAEVRQIRIQQEADRLGIDYADMSDEDVRKEIARRQEDRKADDIAVRDSSGPDAEGDEDMADAAPGPVVEGPRPSELDMPGLWETEGTRPDYDTGHTIIDDAGTEFRKTADGSWVETGDTYDAITAEQKAEWDREIEAAARDLRSEEPSSPAWTGPDSGFERDSPGGLLDQFADRRQADRQQQVDTAASTMDLSQQMGEAATRGDRQIRDARQTRSAAGRDAQITRDQAAREAAQAQRAQSWGTALGDAITDGVQQGMETMASTFGQAAADEAAGQIFGPTRQEREAKREAAAAGGTEGEQVASAGGQAPPAAGSGGPPGPPSDDSDQSHTEGTETASAEPTEDQVSGSSDDRTSSARSRYCYWCQGWSSSNPCMYCGRRTIDPSGSLDTGDTRDTSDQRSEPSGVSGTSGAEEMVMISCSKSCGSPFRVPKSHGYGPGNPFVCAHCKTRARGIQYTCPRPFASSPDCTCNTCHMERSRRAQ